MTARGVERGYPPRGMRRETAAWYIGVGVTKFDEWVARGWMPAGKLVDGCRLWDRFELDDAYPNLPDASESPGLVPATADNPWNRVK